MKSLRNFGFTALLKAAGCDCFLPGTGGGGCAWHAAAFVQPSITFGNVDKVKSVAGSKNSFRMSIARPGTTGKEFSSSRRSVRHFIRVFKYIYYVPYYVWTTIVPGICSRESAAYRRSVNHLLFVRNTILRLCIFVNSFLLSKFYTKLKTRSRKHAARSRKPAKIPHLGQYDM